MTIPRLIINESFVKKDGTAAVYATVHISKKSVKTNREILVDYPYFMNNNNI